MRPLPNQVELNKWKAKLQTKKNSERVRERERERESEQEKERKKTNFDLFKVYGKSDIYIYIYYTCVCTFFQAIFMMMNRIEWSCRMEQG